MRATGRTFASGALWLGIAIGLAPSLAAAIEDSPILRRAKEVVAIISPNPKWSDDLFDPAFLAALPAEKIRALGKELHAQFGPVVESHLTSREGPSGAKFEVTCEKGMVMPMTLTIGATAPFSVIGLWFGAPAPASKSVPDALAELEKLPGRVSVSVSRLGGRIEPVHQIHGDDALAIGSAMKLYILGALVREVTDGKRTWGDVTSLEARRRSLPSGFLHTWPIGSPATLHTLASLMISQSDNTATDHLLFLLGRETVETMLEPMGNRVAARNVPFLSTAEMFRLKGVDGGKPGDAYLARDVAGKRAYLENEISAIGMDAVDVSSLARPNRPDTIEWFASANDLCRAMDWLRRATEKGPSSAARELLAINPGLDVSKSRFPYVGFKGGSEGGVLNLSFLLRSAGGSWLAVSAGWNDPKAPLDEARFFGLVTRLLSLLGKDVDSPEPAKSGGR